MVRTLGHVLILVRVLIVVHVLILVRILILVRVLVLVHVLILVRVLVLVHVLILGYILIRLDSSFCTKISWFVQFAQNSDCPSVDNPTICVGMRNTVVPELRYILDKRLYIFSQKQIQCFHLF